MTGLLCEHCKQRFAHGMYKMTPGGRGGKPIFKLLCAHDAFTLQVTWKSVFNPRTDSFYMVEAWKRIELVKELK